MNGRRGSAAVTATVLLLGACSWAGWTSRDDDAATSAPPASVSSAPELPAVAGLVRDPQGSPAPGALVVLTSTGTPGNPVPEIAVLTDEAGRYRWPAVVQPGRYRVTVETRSGHASTLVTVRSGVTVPADLTLAR